MIKTIISAAALALLVSTGSALVQSNAAVAAPAKATAAKTTAAKPAAKKAPAKAVKEPSADSLKCSQQATEKGLKGTARRKFRTSCLAAARKAAKPAKAKPAAKPAAKPKAKPAAKPKA